MSQKIQQVIMHQFGGPEVLQPAYVPMPIAGEGAVAIRVTAIGVNYSDLLRRTNRYFMPTPLPFVPGTEAVGIITQTGPQAPAHLSVGTRVLAKLPQAGAYAAYVVAPSMFCIPLPPDIDDQSAAALFVQGSTARLLLSHAAHPVKNKTVLIHAAAGGVGGLLVQMALAAGATVVAASSSHEKMQITHAMGAHHSVNYSKPDWSRQVKQVTGGAGVDIIFDMAGGAVYNESLKCLKNGGQMVVYGCASGVQGSIHPEFFVDHHLTQTGFNLAHFIQQHQPQWQDALGNVMHQVQQGAIRVAAPHVFALQDAAAAHRQIAARATTGKVILVP